MRREAGEKLMGLPLTGLWTMQHTAFMDVDSGRPWPDFDSVTDDDRTEKLRGDLIDDERIERRDSDEQAA